VLKTGREVEGSSFGAFDVAVGRTRRLTRGLVGSVLLFSEVGVDGVDGAVSLDFSPVVIELCDRRCLVAAVVADRFKVESPVLEAAIVEVLGVRE